MIRVAERRSTTVCCRAWVAAVLVALVGSGVGCRDNDNSLGGSVEEIYELSFQQVRARSFDSEFAIEYTREDGQVPVRVIVDRGSGGRISEGTIDLDTRGTIVGRVGPRELPEFESGTLKLESFEFSEGGSVEGSFQSTLRSDDSSYSLRGTFSTTLDIVGGSIGYPYPDVGDASAAPDVSDAVDSSGPDTASPPSDDASPDGTGDGS